MVETRFKRTPTWDSVFLQDLRTVIVRWKHRVEQTAHVFVMTTKEQFTLAAITSKRTTVLRHQLTTHVVFVMDTRKIITITLEQVSTNLLQRISTVADPGIRLGGNLKCFPASHVYFFFGGWKSISNQDQTG